MKPSRWRVMKDYWGWSVYGPRSTYFGPAYVNPGWSWRQAFDVAMREATK